MQPAVDKAVHLVHFVAAAERACRCKPVKLCTHTALLRQMRSAPARRNLVSLFSATPDFLKWRDKGFSARPLAVAGALGAGTLDLERLQARRQPRRTLLWYLRSSCKPDSGAAHGVCFAGPLLHIPLCSHSEGKGPRSGSQSCRCLLSRWSSASGRR